MGKHANTYVMAIFDCCREEKKLEMSETKEDVKKQEEKVKKEEEEIRTRGGLGLELDKFEDISCLLYYGCKPNSGVAAKSVLVETLFEALFG